LAKLITAAPKSPILSELPYENIAMTGSVIKTIDVRTIIPRERQLHIFNTFYDLAPRDEFPLVNDRDPKPLYHQCQAELSEQFPWQYLESGSEVRKVRIVVAI
jgi:uncharacterized protein (DUF2249 family)